MHLIPHLNSCLDVTILNQVRYILTWGYVSILFDVILHLGLILSVSYHVRQLKMFFFKILHLKLYSLVNRFITGCLYQ